MQWSTPTFFSRENDQGATTERRDTSLFFACFLFTSIKKTIKARQRSDATKRFSLPTFFSREKKVGESHRQGGGCFR